MITYQSRIKHNMFLILFCDFKGSVSNAPLGRVYVEDEDDWDIADKYFYWVGPQNSMFYLNQTTGSLYASSEIREGR